MAEADCKSTELNGKEQVPLSKLVTDNNCISCQAPQHSAVCTRGVFVSSQVKKKNQERINTREAMPLEARKDNHRPTMVTTP